MLVFSLHILIFSSGKSFSESSSHLNLGLPVESLALIMGAVQIFSREAPGFQKGLTARKLA
jgi:hypothetical protein